MRQAGTTTPNDSSWIAPIARLLEGDGTGGGCLVVFPEYRPDRFQALAHGLGLGVFDFRGRVMAGHGWAADRLGLAELDATLDRLSREGPWLVTNVEALLATKSPDERRHWLARFLETPRGHALLVPLVTLAAELPSQHRRLFRVPAEALGQQSYLNRLAL